MLLPILNRPKWSKWQCEGTLSPSLSQVCSPSFSHFGKRRTRNSFAFTYFSSADLAGQYYVLCKRWSWDLSASVMCLLLNYYSQQSLLVHFQRWLSDELYHDTHGVPYWVAIFPRNLGLFARGGEVLGKNSMHLWQPPQQHNASFLQLFFLPVDNYCSCYLIPLSLSKEMEWMYIKYLCMSEW